MACKDCDFKGYLESYIQTGAGYSRQLRQCFTCDDIGAYSAAVQAMMNEPEEVYRPPGTRKPFKPRIIDPKE